MKKLVHAALALSMSVGLGTTPCLAATPTPVPGGANAVSAVSGNLGQPIFNGVLRLTIVELRPANADEISSVGGLVGQQKAMAMTVLLSNGLHQNFADLVRYTLADKDNVAFEIPDHTITPNPLSILQAASARQKAVFIVDKDFVPVKLVVTCASCSPSLKFRAVRVTLAPT